ncbi:glycosyltransferase family 4 protein [Enterobacter sp.]|uniref:glycosyltransferase family 4 protein n=1 Tax=Enterobacter sp. TaxID=42895 RepID=UPI00296F22B4|nr:glycosyltransferase family 4 protein [Enterobacter sp.]
MKVIHIVHNYYGFSGASLQAKNLASEINKKGDIKQFFFTRINKANKVTHDDDHFNVIPSKCNWTRAITFGRFCLKIKPDIVHFHGADFLLLLVCYCLNIKIYWKSTLLGSDDFRTLCGNGIRGKVKRKLLKRIDVNNTLTKQIYDINREYIDESQLVIVPNGVELPNIDICRDKSKIAIIISALIPRKGIIEGIRFYINNLEKLGYTLHVIGPLDPNLEGYNASYVDECINYRSENIIFEGSLSHTAVKDFLCRAQFLIHLSRKEGMPNVVLEAMAYGLVPILGDMDGLAYELLSSESLGFVVGDKVFNESYYNKMNVEGRHYVETNNGFPVIASKTIAIYEKLMQKKWPK